MNFDHREKNKQEWMDDFTLEGKQLDQALDQLALINRWLGGFEVVRSGLKIFLKKWKERGESRPLDIVDVGCGGGDNLIRLAKWLRKKKIAVNLLGLDANKNVLAYAEKRAQAYPEITFLHVDCLNESFGRMNFDIMLFSLFLHHLDLHTLKKHLPEWCKQSRIGIVINDLHRSRWAYVLFRGITFVFCASAMVRHDGSLSIRRAFSRKELQTLLKYCPVNAYRISWKWAFRWRIIIFS